MLASVHVENVALIKKTDISFDGGFCVLTGETGAGKSILIDSLCLLCGERADRDIIRTGESYALVEGMFTDFGAKAAEYLASEGFEPDEDGNLLVSRRISADGRGVAKINGRGVPAAKLREIAACLVGIHGQQETLSLSDSSRQRELLDRFARDGALLEEYSALYRVACDTEARLQKLRLSERERNSRLDLVKYRISEFNELALKAGEEETLDSEKKRIQSREKIVNSASKAYDLLNASNESVAARAQGAINALDSIKSIIPEVPSLIERLYNIRYEAEDISETVHAYMGDSDEDDASRLDKIEERILKINSLKRKYAVTSADELLKCFADLESEMNELASADSTAEELEKELKADRKALAEAAFRLTQARKNAAKLLTERAKEILCFLDMPNVIFYVDFTEIQPAAFGADGITFLISANRGEEPRPMAKIASGGELARIMLALKRACAETEDIGTMIFDEIDTGISGSTSDKIGMLLAETAKESGCQVICVTHSAQIASHADTHMLISKREEGGRTSTAVKTLCTDERIEELSRIIGGVKVSDETRAASRGLLKAAGRL